MTLQELLQRIRSEEEEYSPLQRQVADYVLKNYQQIPFISITELSKRIGVSHYTVVTFCKRLGFARFSEFKKALSACASNLIIYNKLSGSKPETDSPDSYSSYIDQTLNEDIEAIRTTLLSEDNRANISKVIEMIDSARYIYVAGGRASSSLAKLFARFLRYLNLKVFELDAGDGDFIDHISVIEKKDLVIAICLPRYTAQVVSSLSLLHKGGIPIALITDEGLSPAAPYADVAIRCSVASSSYIQCYSGCLSLISAICRITAIHRNEIASAHVHELEKNLLEQGIFFEG